MTRAERQAELDRLIAVMDRALQEVNNASVRIAALGVIADPNNPNGMVLAPEPGEASASRVIPRNGRGGRRTEFGTRVASPACAEA